MRSTRQRKPRRSTPNDADAAGPAIRSDGLPLHHAPQAPQGSTPRQMPTRRRKRRRAGHRALRPYAVMTMIAISVPIVALLLLLLLDHVWVHHSLSSYPNYSRLAYATQPPIPLHRAKIALASLHEGFKYHGPLGQFLRDNKMSYASLHGYAYVDTFPPEQELAPLREDMADGNRAVYYKKPRMVLRLMEQYDNLDWVLWVDGDAIVTQPYVSVEDRIEEFGLLHEAEQKKRQNDNQVGQRNDDGSNFHPPLPLSLVWAEDSMPNAGVLLLRNSPTSREYLRASLDTWEDTDFFRSFTDQASLIKAGQVNGTYFHSTLLLQKGQATRLQSRVRGPSHGLWKPGHWILHLPNHNYLELLSSLRTVGEQLVISPPPIFPPLKRPSLESLPKVRKERFEAVQEAIRHAWRGYADVCLHSSEYEHSIPCDDLSPVAGRGQNWLHHAATLHDSLDTLAIAFGTESTEYREARDQILSRDMQATSLRPTKTFEYSLRIVGGLLGAFSVTGDVRLLSRARDAADALLQSPFASSPTVLPRMFDVLFPPRGGSILYKIYARVYQWGRDAFTSEHHYNSLAGVGSFALEFYFLSQALGRDTYREVADGIFQHVAKYRGEYDGTVPSQWNVMTGEPTTSWGGLGSGSDSFVEYLLKVPLLACSRSDLADASSQLACDKNHTVLQDMLGLYHKIVSESLRSKHTIRKMGEASIAYPADGSRYHQLLCFVPGLVALGAPTAKATAGAGEDDFALAEALVQGCHDMYSQSPTGLGPEEAQIKPKSSPLATDRRYLLRPEYIESLFVLYRLTGKEEYQEMGWEVFNALSAYCKTDAAYVGLKDVYDPEGGGLVDDMPSYFLAETLKYLLLLFAPDDFLSLEDFVFSTEAHPMRRKQDELVMMSRHIQSELSFNRQYKVFAPFPWSLFGIIVIAGIMLGVAGILLIRQALLLKG